MRLARNLTAAIIAIGVSAGALTISGKSAAQSEAEPQLVVVWGGFWIGPRHHIADLIVYADGQVIYVDQFSDSVWPSIEPWATARIDSDTLQDLVGEVQLGLQRSKGCNVHGPGAADMPVPTIYLKDQSILVFPEKPGFIPTPENEARAACAEVQKVMGRIEALKSLPAQSWQSPALEFEAYPAQPTMTSLSPIQWPPEFSTEMRERQLGSDNENARILTARVAQSPDVRAKALMLLKAATSNTSQPVSIAGTQYQLYDVHEWLPGQDTWEQAIDSAWDQYRQ